MAQVLIVDDDEAARDSMGLALQEEGHAVAGAPNGKAALDFLRNTQGGWVVVLDQLLPVLDGTGFLQAVQADPGLTSQHVYILVIAHAYISTPLLNWAASVGIPILKKPFDVDDLLGVVAQAAACLGEEVGRRCPLFPH